MRDKITTVLGAIVAVWTGYTLYAIARYGGAVLVDSDTTARIMGVRNDEIVHSAVGLTYHGGFGAALVVSEIVIVLAALWFSLRGSGWKRPAAVLILVAWTALWLGNAIWLHSRGWDHSTDLAVFGFAMFVTIAWAGLCLTRSR